jgi:hypothetical protein
MQNTTHKTNTNPTKNQGWTQVPTFMLLLIIKLVISPDFLKFVGPSGQKITRTGNTAKYAGPGVRQNFLFVYFVLHRKSEMQLVCRNDHGQLWIRFYFKWHLLLKYATVSMVILLIIVFL